MFHHFSRDSYLDQLSESFIHLVQNARGITNEILDCIQVIERDQQNVFGPRTQQDLVFESHSHKVIQLQNNKREIWVPSQHRRQHHLDNFMWALDTFFFF